MFGATLRTQRALQMEIKVGQMMRSFSLLVESDLLTHVLLIRLYI